jgi:hypothetical protein
MVTTGHSSPEARVAISPIISADDRIAAARQLRADTPVLRDLLAERRTLIAA